MTSEVMKMVKTQIMPPDAFAALGDGEVAYVRTMTSEDLTRAFPDAPKLAPGLRLWALLGADGSPILLADSRELAEANAAEHDLTTVSVH